MKCLIMSGGEKPKDEVIRKYASSCELIIGVDKGCNYLYDLNITPQYIVGDFDSSKAEVIKKLENLGAAKYKYNCEKDFTDSEEAFELAISKKASEIYFLGSTGKRLDHTLGNLGLLLNALNTGKIAGAGIDVFEEEPTKNNELINHPNVSVTPHIGASTKEAQKRIGEEVITTIINYFSSDISSINAKTIESI